MVDFLHSLPVLYIVKSVVVLLSFLGNSSKIVTVLSIEAVSPMKWLEALPPLVGIDQQAVLA